MPEVEILHRLYTHAATGAGPAEGWKNVRLDERDAADVLPKEVLTALDTLVAKTTPAGPDTAWVVRRFAGHEGTFACLIASYPDLVDDEGGRPALLTHARIVRTQPTQALLDVAALVALAEDFAAGDVRNRAPEHRLQQYLDLLSEEAAVTIREVSVSELDLPRPFLCDVLVACFAGLGKREQTRVAVQAEGSPAAELARAWAAIPVALQRASAWAVGVEDGCPVDVIFDDSGRNAASVGGATLAAFVSRYAGLLLDGPYDFTGVLSNPDMTTVTKLNEALQKAEPLSAFRDFTPVPPKRVDMPKKGKKDDPHVSPGAGELDPDTIAEIDRQFRAMESSIRTLIDQRFAAMERGSQREAAAPRRWTLVHALITLVAIIMTAVLTVALMRFLRPAVDGRQSPTPASITDTSTETSDTSATTSAEPDPALEAKRAALKSAIAGAEVDRKWALGLKAFIESNGAIVSGAIRDAERDLTSSDPARDELERIALSIDEHKLASRDRLRDLLVDAIGGEKGGEKVDGKLDDVNVAVLKERLGVKTASNDAGNIELQSEIIFRWMLRQAQESPR